MELTYKRSIVEVFEDVFLGWGGKETQLFNKGVADVVADTEWHVFPEENVVMEAGDGDSAKWLKSECGGLVDARIGLGRG